MAAVLLGSRDEDALDHDWIRGHLGAFWSNGLVGSITKLAIVLLLWPRIEKGIASLGLTRRQLAS
jgi:putative tricarboxylic transport membrane protein